MSFIMSRQKCGNCGEEWNIATGSFGYGSPKECHKCKLANIHYLGEGWKMSDGTIYPEPYKPEEKQNPPSGGK